jgi:hypothetical protein
MLSEEEINRQIACHVYVDDENHIPDRIDCRSKDLCRGAVCPEGPESASTNDSCKQCIGDYALDDLSKLQPNLNWRNLKDTILLAQLVGIKSLVNK